MTGGDIAGLIAAGVFALLVLLLAVPILKLGGVFDEVRTSIRSIMLSGMALRSTDPGTPEAEAALTKRRPSTSTRVRLDPR